MATPSSDRDASNPDEIKSAVNTETADDVTKSVTHNDTISDTKFNFPLISQSEINTKIQKIETARVKDIASNSEKNILKISTGLNPTNTGNKFPIVFENLPSSSTSNSGNSFSRFVSECGELSMNEVDISAEGIDTGSMQTVSQNEQMSPTKNITSRKHDKLGGFIREDAAFVPKFNIDLSSIFSKEKICSASGEQLDRFKSLTSENSNKKFTGTALAFKPVVGTDTITIVKTGQVRYQCINMMEEYSCKCLEELRSEDYKEDRKGVKSGDFTLKNGGYFVPTTINTLDYQEFVSNTRPNDMQFPATGTNGVRKLLDGIKGLLDSGKHSDVILNVQGKKFNAHKNILSVWSPVLLGMVENEPNENSIDIVNIDDCDPAVFSDFLHFLYTGSAKKVNAKNVSDLYEIARKYQVFELSTICVKYMKNNNPEQACRIS